MVSKLLQDVEMGLINILTKMRYNFVNLQTLYILYRPMPLNLDNKDNDNIGEKKDDYSIVQLTRTSGELFDKYIRFNDEINKDNAVVWLTAGNICMLALDSGDIVGSTWLTTKYYSYSNLKKVRTALDNTANITKLFVQPNFRKKGIGFKLLTNALQQVRDTGVKKASVTIYCYNKASILCFYKMGFKIKYRLYILWLFFVRCHFLTPYKPHS